MYETNVTKKWKKSLKTGKPYMGFVTSKRLSPELEQFQIRCLSYRNVLLQKNPEILQKIQDWIKGGFVLRMDTFFVFEQERIWTKDVNPQVLDADNRRKPMQDGVSKIIGVDDKYIFSGNVEKATCVNKDFEQCLVRIMPVKGRTLQEIHNLITQNSSAF